MAGVEVGSRLLCVRVLCVCVCVLCDDLLSSQPLGLQCGCVGWAVYDVDALPCPMNIKGIDFYFYHHQPNTAKAQSKSASFMQEGALTPNAGLLHFT